MPGETNSSQVDMFPTAKAVTFTPLILDVVGIQVPPGRNAKNQNPTAPNCHIPSKKNNKMLVTKSPNGRPLREPILITKPEYQKWTEKAVQHLESILLSKCPIEFAGTPAARLKLSAILSLLPADDSVNDLPEGSWKVERVPPGQEGATITIQRLT